MATAVEMTIGLGRTVYGAPGAETDSDEITDRDTIEGRETRVSVTWRLTENEQNLVLTASLLAEKTVQVLETADRTIRCQPEVPAPTHRSPAEIQATAQPAAEHPPADERTGSPALTSNAGLTGGNGAASDSAPAAGGRWGTASAAANGNGARSGSSANAYVPRITNAQRLAIQSLCTRHGIADWELRRLVWEEFGKKEQSELTKDQAGELLHVLQQHTASEAAGDHAYAS